jgi:hypothetical protein
LDFCIRDLPDKEHHPGTPVIVKNRIIGVVPEISGYPERTFRLGRISS